MNEIHVEVEIKPQGSSEVLHLPVLRLDGREHISRLYEFDVEVRHPVKEERLDLDKLLAQRAVLRIAVKGADGNATVTRTVRGVIAEAQESLEPETTFSRVYKLALRPAVSDLERFVLQDIYVGASYPAVVEEKLKASGFSSKDYVFRLRDPAAYGEGVWGDGAPEADKQGRLVVQFQESDLAFVSRLCEHVGISYFFEDDGENERLVFTDFPEGFTPRAQPVPWKGDGDDHGFTRMARRLRSIKGDFFAYDYNYRTPLLTFDHGNERLFDVLGGAAHLEVPSVGAMLEYGSNVKTPSEAKQLAEVRADEEEGRRERLIGASVETSLFAGQRVTISGHSEIDETRELLLVSVIHHYRDGASFESGVTEYKNEVEAVFAAKPAAKGRVIGYRPERRTPKPRIHGVVTGIVQAVSEGQSKAYQHIDGQGRYIVKLHFDQGSKIMPRMRMAQPHAGEGYGQHFPLRPGAEVLVGFLCGDPDRPVILGAVPNPIQASPVIASKDSEPLDVNRIKTRSGVIIEISDGPTKAR